MKMEKSPEISEKSRENFNGNVREILTDFTATKPASPAVIDAVDLISHANALFSQGRNYSREDILAPADYFDANPKYAEIMSGILSDLKKLNEYYLDRATRTTEYSEKIRELLSGPGFYDVPEAVWAARPGFVRPETLYEELLSKINLESVLIASARTLESLYLARENHDTSADILQNVFEAETTLVPTLKLMGFDGFAMALSSAAGRLRTEFRGDGKYLDAALADFAKFGSHEDYISGAEKIFANLADDGEFSGELDVKYSDKHHVIMGSGELNLGGVPARVKFRRKSLYSYAAKSQKFDANSATFDEKPADLLGEAIVVPDDADLAEIFANSMKKVRENPDFTEVAAPGRTAAIQVWGDKEFREKIIAKLRKNGFTDEDFTEVIRENGLNLAKITFRFGEKGLPTELQFVGENVNEQMRIGEISHLAYKSGSEVLAEDIAAQHKIHARRNFVGDDTLSEITRGEAGKFLRSVARLAMNIDPNFDKKIAKNENENES